MESALASACEALVSALATGAQDGWDRSSIATQPLSAAIAQVYASARSTADKTGSTHSLLLEAELALQLRIGLLQQNWPRVAAAVSSARTVVLKHTAAEFQAASDKVSLQAAVTANGRILAAATHAGDERALLTALVVAADLGVSELSDLVGFSSVAFATEADAGVQHAKQCLQAIKEGQQMEDATAMEAWHSAKKGLEAAMEGGRATDRNSAEATARLQA